MIVVALMINPSVQAAVDLILKFAADVAALERAVDRQQLIDRMRPARQSASSSSSDGQIGASLTSQLRNRLQWLVSTVIGCCCEQLAVLSYS